MRNQTGEEHEQHDRQNHEQHHRDKVFLELGDHLVLLDDMHHVERRLFHGRHHEREALAVVIGLFEAQYLAVHERIDLVVVGYHGKQPRKAILVHLAEARFVRVERKYIVAAVFHQQRDAAFVLGGGAEGLADLHQVDIFGDNALDLLVLTENRVRDGHHELFALGLDVGARDGKPLVTGGFQVPRLGTEFRRELVEHVAAGTKIVPIRIAVVNIDHVVVVLQVFNEQQAVPLPVRVGMLFRELEEVLFALVEVRLAFLHRLDDVRLGAAVGGRNQRRTQIEEEYKYQCDGYQQDRNRVDKRDAPTQLAPFCVHWVMGQLQHP